ncbi:hypothetical protein DFH11DRAFT_1725806 [Phellopilus nigrolimitatus]|nr:hypothetical protein DFH11DRAFT_1725806 [Phellopilus nigrolimitatus]
MKETLSEFELIERPPGVLPLVVLDGVAESIRDSMGHFIDEVTGQTSSSDRRHWNPQACREDLKSMSLVHRTWTSSAQRALHYRVVLTTSEAIAGFLRNPHCGPWIRELWCTFPLDPDDELDADSAYETDSDDSSDHACSDVAVEPKLLPGFADPFFSGQEQLLSRDVLVTRLVACTPHLRFLAIELGEDGNSPNDDGMYGMLRTIGKLSSLEGLCLLSMLNTDDEQFSILDTDNPLFSYPYLTPLCATLTHLHVLMFLWIENWCYDEKVVLHNNARESPDKSAFSQLQLELSRNSCVSPSSSLSPPPNLKSIVITQAAFKPFPWRHLAWLLHPRNVGGDTVGNSDLVLSSFPSSESVHLYAPENLLLRAEGFRDFVVGSAPVLGDFMMGEECARDLVAASSAHGHSLKRLYMDVFPLFEPVGWLFATEDEMNEAAAAANPPADQDSEHERLLPQNTVLQSLHFSYASLDALRRLRVPHTIKDLQMFLSAWYRDNACPALRKGIEDSQL